MKTVLVTGSAGFIGYHLCKKLLNNNFQVCGIDNFNNYYSKKLKYKRNFKKIKKITLQKADVLKTHGCNKKILKIVKLKNFTDIFEGFDQTIKCSMKQNIR